MTTNKFPFMGANNSFGDAIVIGNYNYTNFRN